MQEVTNGGGLCRGWLASGLIAYCDDAQAQKVIALSGDSLRAFLSKPESKREDWIPIAWFIEAITLVDRTAGSADESLAWPLGSFLASREVGPVHALAARLLRPSIIVSLAPTLWVTHFRNAGRVFAQGRGDRDLFIRLLDVPHRNRMLCMAVGGWMEGFLRLGPRHDICVRHLACSSRGGSACEYTASWMD